MSGGDWLSAEWPAPAGVHTLVTTRNHPQGASRGPYAAFNLGAHCGDNAVAVQSNRALLRRRLPAEPAWLRQVHGVAVADADSPQAEPAAADAAVARQPGRVCVVMSADCLPVLFCDSAGTVVAAAHAGWRGLAAGVLEHTLEAMDRPAAGILAWMGPAIGPAAFEVGQDVYDAFTREDAAARSAFRPSGNGKWHADLYALARLRLQRRGIAGIYGGGLCTHANAARFYSHRRDGATGRMAALIWLQP